MGIELERKILFVGSSPSTPSRPATQKTMSDIAFIHDPRKRSRRGYANSETPQGPGAYVVMACVAHLIWLHCHDVCAVIGGIPTFAGGVDSIGCRSGSSIALDI